MGSAEINTPYDDVFRTLLNDCTSLIIPVVNELFGEHYTGDESVVLFPNEHFMNQQDANTKEKITDSCFEVAGDRTKKYHIECQSTPDNTMLIRMFEYDSQIALDGSEIAGNVLTLTFPHSGALYLRHTRSTPDTLTVQINTPEGNISYRIPVLKLQMYSMDEIFEKRLLFLLPFHIFCYEKELKACEEDGEKLEKLKQRFLLIRNHLEELCQDGEINEYLKSTLIDMSKKVITNITARYETVRKGVMDVMGGKVLEYEAKTILQTGIRQGHEAGRREGRQEGRLDAVVELCKDGFISISEAAKRLNMKEEDLKTYL
jgi:hypothetical protein